MNPRGFISSGLHVTALRVEATSLPPLLECPGCEVGFRDPARLRHHLTAGHCLPPSRVADLMALVVKPDLRLVEEPRELPPDVRPRRRVTAFPQPVAFTVDAAVGACLIREMRGEKVLRAVVESLLAGASNTRAACLAKSSLRTVSRVRRIIDLTWPDALPQSCQCGGELSHAGWCWGR